MIELLTNFNLEELYKKLNLNLNAVLNKDLLKNITPKEGNYIINLQNSYSGSGTHWACFIIKKDIIIYYDSYGVPMPTDLLLFFYRYKKGISIIYSIDQIQHYNSILCGYYCLYFHYYYSKSKLKDNKQILNKHNSYFVKQNRKLNDKILQKLISNIFK